RRGGGAGRPPGGAQRSPARGPALMAEPQRLLLDEPSLGLAPILIERIRDAITEINREGTAVLLVEQNAAMALSLASHGYILEVGKVVMDRPADVLARDDDVREFYFGF